MTEAEWNCASRSQQNDWATNAGLLRLSAFDRILPPWHELPEDWKRRLSDSTTVGKESTLSGESK